MSEIVSKIKYAMSLRTPQEEALSYLDAISSHCDYKKDSKDVVEAAASEYCEKQRKVKAGFDSRHSALLWPPASEKLV